MAVSKMKKLTAAVAKDDKRRLTQILERLSCVEIEEAPYVDPDAEPKAERPASTEAEEARLSVLKLENTIKKLLPYRTEKEGLFAPPQKITFAELAVTDERFERAIKAAEEADGLFVRLEKLKADTAKIKSDIDMLEPWRAYDLPLHADGTKQTSVICGTFPVNVDTDAVCARIEQQISGFYFELAAKGDSAQYVAVIVHKDDEADMLALLSQNGFVRLELSTFTGTAGEAIERLQHEQIRLGDEIKGTTDRLEELAAEIPEMRRACDILRCKAVRAEAERKYTHTKETVILSGWVPERAVEKVTTELEKFDCAYLLADPGPDDEPPTLLINKKPFSPFESVIGMYSLPAYGTFDPTFIMSVFYFVIFGLMLADFVYGLLLTVGGLIAIRFFHLGNDMKRIVKLFAICGVSCMIAGVLFGGYLGDFPVVFAQNMLGKTIESPALWFDPMADPAKFLVVSLAVGLVHLLFGMGIKFYVLWVTGHPFAAIFDVGSWYLVYAGIGLYFLNPTAGIAVAGVGVLMLVVSQGRDAKKPIVRLGKGVLSLYDIVNFVADLLSYSRIMALGMASAVIASVINIISTLFGPSIVGYILMAVILVAANLVNIAINLLGSFVHTSRLQYIEFFGKFYEDGGRPFNPLAPELEYSEITE